MRLSDSRRDLRALWFGNDVSLLGHLHIPRGAALDMAAVVCAAPFGYENICAHRALRILADELAGGGIAALRFDFPGTGDSDGEQRVPAWQAAVRDAVSTIRRETGCTRVAIIGIGLSGTITIASLDGGLDIDNLILWGAPIQGRAWLRQQRAYSRLTAIMPTADEPPPPPTPEGLEEFSGFPMTTALAQELTALDVAQAPAAAWPPGRPRPAVLVFSRTSGETKNYFEAPLGARGIRSTMESYDGFDQMFDEPHLAVAPGKAFARMRDWLAEGASGRAAYAQGSESAGAARTRIGKEGVIEEIARYSQGDGGLLFSIETRPVGRAPDPTWCVWLTGRAVRHVGPNRIWVRFAREIAARGFASLRLDGRSVGDSEGEGNGLMPNEEYYQEHIYDDVERVMEIAVAGGARQFLMSGICSGATASYWVANRRSDVRAIVMLNPLQLRHDPEDDARAKVQLARKWGFRRELWTDPDAYLRTLKGEFPLRKVLEVSYYRLKGLLSFQRKPGQNERSYVYTGIQKLADKPVDIDIFLSGQDVNAISFLERHFGVGLTDLDREHLRLHRVPNTDHTIRPLFGQARFFKVLRSSLARIAGGESAPATLAETGGQAAKVR